ncbi:MAG: ubiquinone/menaquinone biosynthesis methyltransferase [Dissulfurispiraceae bacterium]
MIGKMFDDIDKRYDFLNHLFSLYLDCFWRRMMLKKLMPLNGREVLDLATGTGDSAVDLIKTGVKVIGLDLSFNMLLRARSKIQNPRFFTVSGSAYSMPFKDNSFDGITCAFGIRNMHETSAALKEIFRVLRKGGKVVFLEFSMPETIIRIPYRFYLRYVIPNVARIISKKEAYTYLGKSIQGFHRPEDFCRLILESGFASCEKFPLSMGLVFIHKAVKQ